MKNRLYVIGDSFSAKYYSNNNQIGDRYREYRDFKGGVLPKTWSELLADELNLELVNLAEGGASNYQIFDGFCEVSQSINKKDILFVGWTDTMRFRFYSDYTKRFEKASLQTEKDRLPNISQKTIDEIIVNRSNDYWTSEVYNWMKVINRMSKVIGFEVHYWSFFGQFPEFNIFPTLLNMGATRIFEETNDLVKDAHFGEKGHQVQFEFFLNKLKTKKLI